MQIDPIPVEPSGLPFFDTGVDWRLYQDHGSMDIMGAFAQSAIHIWRADFSHDFHSGEIFTIGKRSGTR